MVGILAAVIAVTLSASTAWAFMPSGQLQKITKIIKWEDGEVRVAFGLSDGNFCYFAVNTDSGKASLALVTSAFLANKSVAVWCYDSTESIGGLAAHRFHRIDVVSY